VFEEVLDHMERMLNLGADAGLGRLYLGDEIAQGGTRQCFDLAGSLGDVPLHGRLGTFRSLFNPLVARIAEGRLFIAVQQGLGLRNIADMTGRPKHRMHQAGMDIDAKGRLHAKVPLVAFLALVHLRVALARLVLRRGRGGNQGRIDERAFSQHQSPGRKMVGNRIEDRLGQLMTFQKMTEVQQGRRIRRALPRQVDTDKGTNCLTVVNRVLNPFVRQPETLLP